LRHDRNSGKGAALRTGIEAAQSDSIIWIDADDTYPPEAIPRMVRALQDGYDLVYASRSSGREHIPFFNRLGNAVFAWMAHSLYGFKPSDPFSGLCGVQKQHLQRMGLEATGFAIEVEVAMKAGRMNLKMLDIPIEYGQRIGESKLNGPRDGLAIGLHLLRFLRWKPPAADATRNK
jgi:glycosyltransferase involved in cell wall biosynthesis